VGGITYETLLLERRGKVALVTLNRPDQLNTLTPRMGLELGHAFTTLDASEDVRAIVVTGAGRAFCAGAALDPESTPFGAKHDRADLGTPHISQVSPWTMATPVLAAINGHAVGVGLTYALQWDIRVAATDAKLGFVFTRRGLVPEANSLWMLSRAVGASRALELLLTGRTFSGAEAFEIGLVSQALPAGEVLEATLALATDIAEHTSPASVALTKKLFYAQLASPDRVAGRAVERAAFDWMLSQPDSAEGISSFLERRPPQWQMSKHVPVPTAPEEAP
jgi:enoyl-CoA hydratase/carnithine racemase